MSKETGTGLPGMHLLAFCLSGIFQHHTYAYDFPIIIGRFPRKLNESSESHFFFFFFFFANDRDWEPGIIGIILSRILLNWNVTNAVI